jgi:hypothetical protein
LTSSNAKQSITAAQKRPCCVFLCCASALRTLTTVKRIEKWPPELQRLVSILQHVLQYFYILQFCTDEYSMLNTTCNHRMQPAAARCRSANNTTEQQVLFCEILWFQTYPASDLFSTMNCRIERHGCACAAKYCL